MEQVFPKAGHWTLLTAVLAAMPCPSLPQNEHAPLSVLGGVVVRGRLTMGLGVAWAWP